MGDRISLPRFIAKTINTFAAAFYQDIFAIESFTYLQDESDIIVSYRVNGKRKPVLSMHLTLLMKNQKMLNCFSRIDAGEIGMLYGRLMEKKIQNNKIKALQLELALKNHSQIKDADQI